MTKPGARPNDLIGLNFGGEKTIMVKRSLLCQIEGSNLATMFSGHQDDQLEYDKDGNVVFGYPPSVMVPLMDWLTVYRDLPPEAQLPDIFIPAEYKSTWDKSVWDGAVKCFGLESQIPPPPAEFSGVKMHVDISELEGWEVAFCQPYFSHPTTSSDFQLPGVSSDSPALIATRRKGEETLLVAAIGRLDIITATSNDGTLHNGTYWTLVPGLFFAFADTNGPYKKTYVRELINVGSNAIMEKASIWLCCEPPIHWKGCFDLEKVIMIPKRPLLIGV